MKTWIKVIFLLGALFCSGVQAEGTKQWTPTASENTYLKVNSGGNYAFAGYGVAANKRLYIHIDSPMSEVVYLGFSRMVNEPANVDLTTPYTFQIRSPSGAVVHGPFSVTAPNITSHAMAAAGPDALVAGGYPVGGNAMWTFTPTVSGDHYIEFDTAGSIRWFDITVANNTLSSAIDGRVWSQAWAVRADNGYTGLANAFDTPFTGKFVAYDGQFATQIDFAGSGIRPLEGQFSFNQTGPGSSGNIENDRRSVEGSNATNPFHKIFLNQPDPSVYPLSPQGVLTNQPITIVNPAVPQLPLEVSQPGQVEIVMNFGPGNERRLFADVVAGVNLIPWDGQDGNGVTIGIEDYPVPVSVSYTQGVTHFTAYDVEGLDNGFEVRTQTAAGTIGPNTQYWDDTNIPDNPGTADAQVNVDTGASTRRRWNQNNYGDLNTINTWWYAYQGIDTTTMVAPGDYGDAPDSYGEAFHVDPDSTTVHLGTVAPDVDTDTLNTASGGADGEGDDADNTDDEDGISVFPALTIATTSYTLPAANITVSNASGGDATLYGFIDFNNDGDFVDAGESVSVNVSAGATQPDTDLVFTGFTMAASAGTTYARFRITTQAGVGPDWVAADGEVEDYALPISVTAPVTPPTPTGNPGTCWAITDNDTTIYKFTPNVASPQPPTTISTSRSNNGEGLAWRPSTNELYMWDSDTTYVLDANTGTDVRSFTADLSPGNSVEGATFYVNPGTLQEELWLTVENYVSGSRRNDRYLIRIDPDTGTSIASFGPMNGGYIDPNVDYGKDTGGLAIDPNSKQFWITNDGLARGLYPLDDSTATVQSGTLFSPSQVDAETLAFANDGYLYTESDEGPSTDRYVWRITDVSTGTIVRAAGPFPGSGDVEGMACDGGANLFISTDYGDAPTSGTAPDGSSAIAYGEASHTIVSGIYLGAGDPDADSANQPTINADGDDTDGTNDDDGIILPALTQGQNATISVNVAQAAVNDGYLQGWIDWNGDGDFADAGEQVATDLQLASGTSGTINIAVTVPADITTNQTFSRFRWSTTAGLNSTTAASDGEVEDYALTITASPPDTIARPTQCGAFNTQGWITNAGTVHDNDIQFGSGNASDDPNVFVPLGRDADGRVLSYLGTPDEIASGFLPARAGTDLVMSAHNVANPEAEYHITVFRLEGAPGTTQNVTYDTNAGAEYSAYWIENTSGTVLSSADFVYTFASGGGIGESFSIPITYPADGIVYLYTTLFDPSAAYGKPTILDYECPLSLSGIVFEDIDYGGGTGRDQATSSGAGVNGATVELYDNTGALVATTITANDGSNDGAYTFDNMLAGDYYVRVVSNTVSSTRAGSDGSELAVQTFRTDGTTAVTSEVGGRYPAQADASTNPGGATLNDPANGDFSFLGGPMSGPAQSVTPVTMAATDITGIDFGFNFNTIVNTNNSGQGSLRQFILNSNQLTDIPNQGINAGQETSVFMIPDGTGYAGTASHGALDLSTGGLFTISPASVLPAITDSQTAIDGGTQNNAQCDPAAAGGRVLNIALDGAGLSGSESGLTLQGSDYLVRALAVGNFPAPGLDINTNANNGHIVCNHIGINANGTAATPNSDNGIVISSVNNTQVGNGSAAGRNVISGNNGNGSTLGDTGHGIRIENNANNVTFLDNYIGLDASGTSAIPNNADGINVNNSTNIVIGNDTPAGRNVISGNTGQGIYALGNTVTIDITNNYIGTDRSGLNAVGNNHGIYLNQTAGGHSIRNNVASGQRGYGIILYYSPNNTITGNIVGLDKDGLNIVGNARSGLWIAKTGATSSTGNQVGGTTPAERNVFSGNGDYGVLVEDVPAGNTITGNYIGTDISGNSAAPNTLGGVLIKDAPDTVLGGTGAGEGNVISGNTGIGVGIARANSSNAQIFGNLIGRNASNTTALGNGGSGVVVYDNAPDNTIGGRGAGEGNIIAHNGRNGVEVDAPGAITIVGNSLYANGQLGIDLDNNNVTLNDANDTDTGSNSRLNFPQFNQITISGTNLIVAGCAPAGATLDLFEADVSPTSASGEPVGANQMGKLQDYGEGERALFTLTEGVGEDTTTSPVNCNSFIDVDGNDATGMSPFQWTLPLPTGLVIGDQVTATSTLAGVGTSEFSGTHEVSSLDYSDAPTSYGDAAHSVVSGIQLGPAIDVDTGSLASVNADGDGNDDDGVRLNGTTLQNQVLNNNSATTLVVTTQGSGRLHVWIDWDRDGTFGNNVNEQVISETANAIGPRSFSVIPPNGLTPGVSFARFRYSSDAAATSPSSTAADGEVEDYRVTLGRGFTISGRVFNDTNVDSVNDAAEAGVTELPVVLYDTVNGTCISTRTNANGEYSFDDVVPGDYQVYEASQESVPLPQNCDPANARDPGGYLSTTANASAVFTVSNASVAGIDFGDVKPPVFELDNAQTILPNTTALHPHLFTALSDGSVSFSIVTETANPATVSWGTQLLVDSNCDGLLDSGDTAMPASINMTAGQQVCILTKVLSPADVPAGAVHTLDIQSNFTFGNGTSLLSNVIQTRQDITRSAAGTTTEPEPTGTPDPIGGEGKLSLVKSVWNATRGTAVGDNDGSVALPGETLQYTIAYENIGNGPLNELVITDSVPEFTQLVPASMLCTDKPAELPLCATNDSLDGSLSWSWTTGDKLLPGSSGSVSYQVVIE